MSVEILRGNALALGLADASVDLIVTSPPYFGLRSYQDGGEHYAGQIGDEPTPAEFVDALIAATAEMVRVLKPSGSIWVNLGDKYQATSFAPQQRGKDTPGTPRPTATKDCERCGAEFTGGLGRRFCSAFCGGSDNSPRSARGGIPVKSLIGIPWRYAIRCIDDLGLILRAEVIWSKPNGLPESVTDRVRRSHEQWFHMTREPRYFSAVDEIREAHLAPNRSGTNPKHESAPFAAGIPAHTSLSTTQPNPLGKLPGSVWTDDPMSVSQSRIGLVLEAVSAGHITPEEGERILWSHSQSSWIESPSRTDAGSGSSTATHAATPRSASEGEGRSSCTESPTSSTSAPSQKASRSTTSAGTRAASDPTTSSPSPSPRTSDEHTPSATPAPGATLSQTPTPKSPGTAGSPSAAASATRTGRSDAGESVWVVPTEPLHVPDHLGIDHFAAFPTEFPRRIIAGWSPSGICTECGEGRRPVASSTNEPNVRLAVRTVDRAAMSGGTERSTLGRSASTVITGEACACPEPTAPTRPAVVLDPFGGTGTTALVAHALGRHGISNDMSADYCRLATWRTTDPKQIAKAARREYKPSAEKIDGQLDLLEGLGA